MRRWFTTAHLAVLALFVAVSAGLVGYQILYVWPAERCEQSGAWWDARDRQCLTPIPIKRFTGRDLAAYKPARPAPITRPANPAR